MAFSCDTQDCSQVDRQALRSWQGSVRPASRLLGCLIIANIQHFHFLIMIKTLFASLCVVACCMGNEYPAKAYESGCNTECFSRQREQARRQFDQEQRFKKLERRVIDSQPSHNGYSWSQPSF